MLTRSALRKTHLPSCSSISPSHCPSHSSNLKTPVISRSAKRRIQTPATPSQPQTLLNFNEVPPSPNKDDATPQPKVLVSASQDPPELPKATPGYILSRFLEVSADVCVSPPGSKPHCSNSEPGKGHSLRKRTAPISYAELAGHRRKSRRLNEHGAKVLVFPTALVEEAPHEDLETLERLSQVPEAETPDVSVFSTCPVTEQEPAVPGMTELPGDPSAPREEPEKKSVEEEQPQLESHVVLDTPALDTKPPPPADPTVSSLEVVPNTEKSTEETSKSGVEELVPKDLTADDEIVTGVVEVLDVYEPSTHDENTKISLEPSSTPSEEVPCAAVPLKESNSAVEIAAEDTQLTGKPSFIVLPKSRRDSFGTSFALPAQWLSQNIHTPPSPPRRVSLPASLKLPTSPPPPSSPTSPVQAKRPISPLAFSESSTPLALVSPPRSSSGSLKPASPSTKRRSTLSKQLHLRAAINRWRRNGFPLRECEQLPPVHSLSKYFPRSELAKSPLVSAPPTSPTSPSSVDSSLNLRKSWSKLSPLHRLTLSSVKEDASRLTLKTSGSSSLLTVAPLVLSPK